MKLTLPLLAGLFVVAPLGAQNIKINLDPSQPADAAKPATPAAAPAAAPAQELIPPGPGGQYTDAQKMEMYGYILAAQLRMAEQVTPLIGNKEELVSFLNGLGAAMANQQLPYEPKPLLEQTQTMVKSRAEAVQARVAKALAEMKEVNGKDAAAFLATLDAKPGVKKTASGLRYEIIQEGTGAKAKPTQAVRPAYKASFLNGEVFDTSENKGAKFEFNLATSIPGLKEGLQLVGTGGKVKLYVPSELGFGDSGQVMAPGVLTIFEVEILEVKEPAKQPEAPVAAK